MKKFITSAFGLAVLALSNMVLAAPPDYTEIIEGFDVSTLLTVLATMFITLIGLRLFVAGATLIWRKVAGVKAG